MSEFPVPPVDDLNRKFWDGLQAGQLRFQRCQECRNAWLPPREECPSCWSDQWVYEASSGRATLISWIVYHKAYHPYFQDKIPYNVGVVELEEGPRMLTNLVTDDHASLEIDQPVELVIQEEAGFALARFKPAAPGDTV